MNVVVILFVDGYLLWNKMKMINNFNVLYIDGKVVVGIGKGGSMLLVDLVSGVELDDFGFMKRLCVCLMVTLDLFFCCGWFDGLSCYDCDRKKVLFNGVV